MGNSEASDMEVMHIYNSVSAEYAFAFVTPKIEIDEGPYLRKLVTISRAEGPLFLDVGCGPAVYYKLATSMGLQYVGVDFAAKMLTVGKELFPRSSLVRADARTLPVRAGMVSFAVAMGSLSHMDHVGFRAALQEIRRCLSPSGAFLLGDQLGVRTERAVYPLGGAHSIWVYARPKEWYEEEFALARLKIVALEVREPEINEMSYQKILIWAIRNR